MDCSIYTYVVLIAVASYLVRYLYAIANLISVTWLDLTVHMYCIAPHLTPMYTAVLTIKYQHNVYT